MDGENVATHFFDAVLVDFADMLGSSDEDGCTQVRYALEDISYLSVLQRVGKCILDQQKILSHLGYLQRLHMIFSLHSLARQAKQAHNNEIETSQNFISKLLALICITIVQIYANLLMGKN